MILKMKMPDLSTNDATVKVVRWRVEAGQRVERGQALLEVETDKAAMEVEAIASGTLVELCVAADQEVETGTVIAIIDAEARR
jgi:pyruvate/2-oxoglutarate dehydrogenase complex dihydrolipoamide acyltransferase (E2) component